MVVTGNMFGDILSDEAAMLTGSIGTAIGIVGRHKQGACTSPATAARPTSPVRALQTRWLQFCLLQ